MENQAEEVIEINTDSSQSPVKTIGRRRFVQSTLFPQKSPEKKDVGGVDVVGEGGEEECWGSQGRKKRKQTPGRKPASQSRRAKQVAQNGKAVFQELVDEENLCCTETDTGTGNGHGEASLQKQKVKRRAPSRKRRTNLMQYDCKRRLPDQTIPTGHIPQPIPDLRLKSSEEGSRRFGGRQLHMSFFSSWKAGKKGQEMVKSEFGQSLFKKKNKNVECGPIHVHETFKDNNITSIDWSNWAFHDGVYDNPNCHEQITSSSDGFVECLRLDQFFHISSSLREPRLDHGSASHEEVAKKAMTPSPSHDVADPCHPLEVINVVTNLNDHPVAELIFRSENSSCMVSDVGQDNSASQEWLSYSFHRTNQPQNSLWTCKYQPEKAAEVCGNAESVKLINDWLGLWRERDLWNCKKSFKSKKCSLEEDCSSYDIDSDVESVEEAGLKNVMLVMGPVGSGKSAAIYACAKEQGFDITEVNSSDWRNGDLIKQKFAEAVRLHWFKWTNENPKGLQSTVKTKFPLATPTSASTADEFIGDAIRPITIPDDETVNDCGAMSQRSVCSETNIRDSEEVKTLLLFEEVDATMFEDRGLIASIQQLAQIAKRPMILTSNNCRTVLPESLSREEVYFSIPSQKELFHHVCTIFNAEKSNKDPLVIERYIKYCQGDVRKTLMHLQFWCQGQEPKMDRSAHSFYSPLVFDLEAGHDILSKIIPWRFSSQLSEHIEMEIEKSSCRMEEDPGLFEVSEEVEITTKLDKDDVDEGLRASIEAKKGAILSSNFVSNDCDLIAQVTNPSGVSSSESPVAYSRRKSCRRLGVVLFDSDDAISNYEPPGKSDNLCRDSNNEIEVGAVDPETQIRWPALDEGSRMDFCRGGKRVKRCNSKLQKNLVQETWKELRCADFRLQITEEDKDASQAMRLASRMCDLIADADMLLTNCQNLTTESFEPGIDLVEDLFTFGWHDQQLHMTSAIAEHGYCIFAKDVATLGSRIGLDCRVDIAREMLASTNNSIALGKLLRHGQRTEQTPVPSRQLESGLNPTGNSSEREREASLHEIVHSVVPRKCHLTLRGSTLKDYLSTLAHMSKSDAHRTTESPDNTRRRRKRVRKNYLCSGPLYLSPEDISLLVAFNYSRKCPSETK